MFETFTGAIFSTAHITPADNKLLAAQAAGTLLPGSLIVDDYPYGYWVLVPATPTESEADGLTEFSPEFQALYALARAQGWSYLKLDQDGPVMADLPTFDW